MQSNRSAVRPRSGTYERLLDGSESVDLGNDHATPSPSESQGFDQQSSHESAPPDSWNISYWIFFLLGTGMLFPWNVFITADGYFRQRFVGSVFTVTIPIIMIALFYIIYTNTITLNNINLIFTFNVYLFIVICVYLL
jgi:hypothetical protein